MKLWQECKYKYYEKYVKGIELDWEKKGVTAAQFGTRMHQLFEERYLDLKGTPRAPYPEFPLEAVELEAQVTMAAYLNHYPLEPFTVLDVEKTFRVPLGERHEYVGKFDVILLDPQTGMLSIMDHKTEKRQGQNNNPKAWAARTQATLYLWAAPQVYEGEFRDLLVNVIRRQSDKGQIGPEFPERQRIQRTPEQMDLAVKGLVKIADEIEFAKANWTEEDWQIAANRNECMVGNFECEFYFPHLEGWTEELIQIQYRKTEPYLDL
jgi:hypothetical protein